MDDTAKHQLEGLLKARSDGIRHRRQPRNPRDAASTTGPRAMAEAAPGYAATPVRECADCATPIGVRRVRAMPGATRCIECQRVAEMAPART